MTTATRMLFGLAVSAAFLLAAGCCDQPTRDRLAILEQANEDCRNRTRALEDDLRAKDAEAANLQSQLAAQDATIGGLRDQLASRGAAPVEVKQTVTQRAGELTGFEESGEVTRGAGWVAVSVPADLLFDSGKATLKSKGSLGKIAGVLRSKYAGHRIHVIGHTDPDPIQKSGWKDNWDLGFNRARTVALELIKDGVPKNNVTMASAAETRPHGGGKAKDRRVEIQVILREGQR